MGLMWLVSTVLGAWCVGGRLHNCSILYQENCKRLRNMRKLQSSRWYGVSAFKRYLRLQASNVKIKERSQIYKWVMHYAVFEIPNAFSHRNKVVSGDVNWYNPSRNQFHNNGLKCHKIYTCFCPVILHLRIFRKEIISATEKIYEKNSQHRVTMARKIRALNGFFPFQQRFSLWSTEFRI